MAYIYNMTDTWNDAATVFTAIKMDVTNTASAANSKIISLKINGTEIFGVNKDGDAGIGTSTPVSKLHVNNSTAVATYTTTGNSIGGTVIGVNAAGASVVGTYASNVLLFGNYNSGGTFVEFARIDSDGSLLVGTTGQISGSYGSIANFVGGNVNGIGIKTTASAYSPLMFWNSSTVLSGSVTLSGSSVSYNTTSDQRLKENIADADDAAGLIDAIQVRKFDWKADGSHQRYGFIAQELREVAPEVVHVPEDEDQMMSVDYSKLVPMLVKEVQSLRARVAELEAK